MAELKACDYSKDDLVFIIKRMCFFDFGNRHLDRALSDLRYEKEKKRLDTADVVCKQASKKRNEYIELLSPYNGKPWSDIPLEILKKAAELQKEAQRLDVKWNKLMRIGE